MSDDGPGDENSDVADETATEEVPLEEIPLSLDAMLDILADRRRRLLLEYLRERPDYTGTYEEATKYILTELARKEGEQPSHDEVQVDLQHRQLPRLAEAGIIEFDVRSQMIRYQSNEHLEALHETIRDFETN